MGERFFSATAMGGRLYVQGMSDRGPWDPKHLFYLDERVVDLIANQRATDQKIRTSDELQAAIMLSERGLPTIKIWISEEMESMVKRLWEVRGGQEG